MPPDYRSSLLKADTTRRIAAAHQSGAARKNRCHEFIEITAREKIARNTCDLRRLDVGIFVANHKAASAVHRPATEQIIHHSSCRFAPIRYSTICRHSSLRMIGTVAQIIDAGSLDSKYISHPAMQSVNIGFLKESARYSRLVG